MKARDPSISIVAGAFNQPWDANIRAFCRAISNSLDVFSVHIYGGGATTNRATIYDEADMTAGIAPCRFITNTQALHIISVQSSELKVILRSGCRPLRLKT